MPFTSAVLYGFVALFVALAVAVPWACHQIHPLAGPVLLPLFFFVIMAGLLCGWRAGLLVGILTPVVSFSISGLPLPALMPRIITEAACYGFFAGLFVERYTTNAVIAIAGTQILGRLCTWLVLSLPLLAVAHPFSEIWTAVTLGWPGIVLQLVVLPLILKHLPPRSVRNVL